MPEVRIPDRIRAEGSVFASRRGPDYLSIRRELEARTRAMFLAKGGRPVRKAPHYMTLGACPWLLAWYRDGRAIRLPLANFDPQTISFTYGDLFPAMRFDDGKPYRRQVYLLEEIEGIVERYGLPQDWNADGRLGPERYIEAQVWDDAPLTKYLACG